MSLILRPTPFAERAVMLTSMTAGGGARHRAYCGRRSKSNGSTTCTSTPERSGVLCEAGMTSRAVSWSTWWWASASTPRGRNSRRSCRASRPWATSAAARFRPTGSAMKRPSRCSAPPPLAQIRLSAGWAKLALHRCPRTWRRPAAPAGISPRGVDADAHHHVLQLTTEVQAPASQRMPQTFGR